MLSEAVFFFYLALFAVFIVGLTHYSQWRVSRWKRSYRNSKYGRRIREKARIYQEEAEQRRKEAAYEGYHKDIIVALDAIKQELYSANEEYTPKNKNDHLWHRAEVFGLWAAAIVGAIAIIIGTIDSSRQLSEMRDEQRAWVSISKPVTIASDIKVSADPNFIITTLNIALENTGKNPAIGVSIRFAPTLKAPDFFTNTSAYERLACGEQRASGGINIFPQQTAELLPQEFLTPSTDANRGIQETGPRYRFKTPIVVAVCVTYTDAVTKKYGCSAYGYLISNKPVIPAEGIVWPATPLTSNEIIAKTDDLFIFEVSTKDLPPC